MLSRVLIYCGFYAVQAGVLAMALSFALKGQFLPMMCLVYFSAGWQLFAGFVKHPSKDVRTETEHVLMYLHPNYETYVKSQTKN